MAKPSSAGIDKKIVGIIAVVMLAAGVGIGALVVNLTKNKGDEKKDSSESLSIDQVIQTAEDVEKYLKLGDYKGIDVSLAVSQDDIDAEIDSLLEEYTTYEEKTGTVKDGDMIYADFEGTVNGKIVEDTCGSDYISIGSGEWLDGFEDNIIGTSTGNKVKFTIAVPEDTYGDDSIDGKNVEFTVKVLYICGEEIIPEYNDEFVKSISEYKTVEEYDEYIKTTLAEENTNDQNEYAWDEVMEKCEVKEYPDSYMDAANKEVLQGYYDMADLYGCTQDEVFQNFGYDSEEDFVNSDLEELAQDTAKSRMVAKAISILENITYSDEDYQSVVEEEYSYNEEYYDSQEDYELANKDYLESTTLANIVKEWIGENANFTL